MPQSNNFLRMMSGQVLKCGNGHLNSKLQIQKLQRLLPSMTNTIQTVRSTHSISSTRTKKIFTTTPTRTRPLHLTMIPKSIDDLNTCSFSTVAAAQEQEEESFSPKKPTKTKSRGGRTTKRKDPLIIKPAAAARIKELLSSSNGEDAIGIRLGVKRRGCNGLSYTMNYAFEKEPNEEEMEAYGVRVMIEPMALFSVVGTEMDWVETDMTSEFTFRNPNSKGECGCGESFNV